jgi:hypothetical protein
MRIGTKYKTQLSSSENDSAAIMGLRGQYKANSPIKPAYKIY